MSKPILILHKKVEKIYNRITLPKKFVEKWGKEYYMNVYADRIEIIPIKDHNNGKEM